MTREEFIRELHSVVYDERRNYRKFGDNTRKNITLDTYLSERIADFIISRQKLLLEKIGKVNDILKNIYIVEDSKLYIDDQIKKALAIIEKEGGE